jgi:hypothetical protein
VCIRVSVDREAGGDECFCEVRMKGARKQIQRNGHTQTHTQKNKRKSDCFFWTLFHNEGIESCDWSGID